MVVSAVVIVNNNPLISGEAGPIKGVGAMSVFSVESPPPILGLGEENEEDKLPNDG